MHQPWWASTQLAGREHLFASGWVGFLAGLLRADPSTHLVDVGCGPGRHARALAAPGLMVTGVDISLPFLHAAGPGRWLRGDARALSVGSGTADGVLCLCQGGLGLLGGDDEAVALTEMARILRPGGRLVLSAFSTCFTPQELRLLIAAAGLVTEHL